MALATVPSLRQAVIASAAFAGVSSLSASWALGAYRRLQAKLRIDSGTANGYMTFLGLTGETYSRTGYYASPTAVFTSWTATATASAWVVQGVGNQMADVDVDITCAAGVQKTFRSRAADMGGYQAFLAGTCSDATAAVSGVAVTFLGATSGWFELAGFS